MTFTKRKQLGKMLRDLRKEAGYTQKELGEMISYNHSWISRVEKGEYVPTEKQLGEFLQKLLPPEDVSQALCVLRQEAALELEANAEKLIPAPPSLPVSDAQQPTSSGAQGTLVIDLPARRKIIVFAFVVIVIGLVLIGYVLPLLLAAETSLNEKQDNPTLDAVGTSFSSTPTVSATPVLTAKPNPSLTAQLEANPLDEIQTIDNSILGTLYGLDHQPITGVKIDVGAYINENYGPLQAVCSDPITGQYILTGLPFGTYFVKAAGTGLECENRNFAQEFWPGRSVSPRPTPITLSETHPTQSNIDFTLSIGGTIMGVVIDEDGNPIAHLWMQTDGSGITGDCTETDGSYILTKLPLGEYVVIPLPGLYCGPDSAINYLTGGEDGASASTQAKHLVLNAPDQVIPDVNFKLKATQ
jgi:transcriptional regulator with XRE-family HTH domain